MDTMNPPAKRETRVRQEFRSWLKGVSFTNSGDRLERRYFHLLADFPRLEAFWRFFVVPLTERLKGRQSIGFRNGVDPALRYICAANYSLYVHLVFAKIILTKWDETSLEAVYGRLASAFDVFEMLIIRFHLLMCECKKMKSPLLNELSEEGFLDLAKVFYHKNYESLFQLYLSVGKKPPSINIPSKGDIVNEYFKGNIYRSSHKTISTQEIRQFRNVIVHDVRIGGFQIGDSVLVPKSSVIQKYRQWSDIAKVAGDADVIERDFCEAKTQCAYEVDRTVNVLNALYEQILKDFEEEFYTPQRSTLRDLFGIEFKENACAVMASLDEGMTAGSGHFDISLPPPVSGTSNLPLNTAEGSPLGES